jgi:hypothetical protein
MLKCGLKGLAMVRATRGREGIVPLANRRAEAVRDLRATKAVALRVAEVVDRAPLLKNLDMLAYWRRDVKKTFVLCAPSRTAKRAGPAYAGLGPQNEKRPHCGLDEREERTCKEILQKLYGNQAPPIPDGQCCAAGGRRAGIAQERVFFSSEGLSTAPREASAQQQGGYHEQLQ